MAVGPSEKARLSSWCLPRIRRSPCGTESAAFKRGCTLEMLFDTNNQALETAADFLIQSAIQKHLSEILTVSQLSLRRDDGMLEITLSYVLRETGEPVSDTFRREV